MCLVGRSDTRCPDPPDPRVKVLKRHPVPHRVKVSRLSEMAKTVDSVTFSPRVKVLKRAESDDSVKSDEMCRKCRSKGPDTRSDDTESAESDQNGRK